PKARKGRILFINAVDEVTRERAQSFLTNDHIERMVDAYRAFRDESGFTRVGILTEIRARDYSLAIPLYVVPSVSNPTADGAKTASVHDTVDAWLKSRDQVAAVLGEVLTRLPQPAALVRFAGAGSCGLLKDKAQ